MISGNVQATKVVFVLLDMRTIDDFVTHTGEDLFDLCRDLADRMQAADVTYFFWQRHINGGIVLSTRDAYLGRRQRIFQRGLHLIQNRAERAFVCARRCGKAFFQSFQKPVTSHHRDPHNLDGGGIGGSSKPSDGVFLQL